MIATRYTFGKRVEIGLGAETAVGLSAARRLANQMREATVLGRNPRDVVEPHAPAKLILTFGEYADTYVASVESGWKSVTHREQWRHSLQHHAHNLRGMQISQISTEDVLEVLRPIWLRKLPVLSVFFSGMRVASRNTRH